MKPEGIETVAGDKNVMPSMVVRQQRNQMINLNQQRPASAGSCLDGESTPSLLLEAARQTNLPQSQQPQQLLQNQQQFDQDGLVIPKKVLHHPVSVAQPIIRDLNRELKFNQARGKNVLDQKSELKKALEKLEESKRKKEAEQERLNRRSSLEMRLEERAERIAKEATSAATTEAAAAAAVAATTITQRAQSATEPASASAAGTCAKLSSNFSIRSMR